MPQVKITLSDRSLEFLDRFPQFTRSDIINAAIAAIAPVNASDIDSRARLGLVMIGAGVVVDAESHLRSVMLAGAPSTTQTQTPTPSQTPSSTVTKSSGIPAPKASASAPAEAPAAPILPANMLDPEITQAELDRYARHGFVPPPGVPRQEVNRLFIKGEAAKSRAKNEARAAEQAKAAADQQFQGRLKARGLRDHDVEARVELRDLGNAVGPTIVAGITAGIGAGVDEATGKPVLPTEPLPVPVIPAVAERTYELIAPTGTVCTFTQAEWDAIKDDMGLGMMAAFYDRENWYWGTRPLDPWQTLVKAWLDHADGKGMRSQWIPKQRPKFWEDVKTYTVNEPGLDEISPDGTTFSAVCFHDNWDGDCVRFAWVRRFPLLSDNKYIRFSFHDVLRALGVTQFALWFVDLDLPRGLYDQWKEVDNELNAKIAAGTDDENVRYKLHDCYDLDKRYKKFPPEYGFEVHEGILWVTLLGLYHIKGTVLRALGDADHDAFTGWLEGSADQRAYRALILKMYEPSYVPFNSGNDGPVQVN